MMTHGVDTREAVSHRDERLTRRRWRRIVEAVTVSMLWAVSLMAVARVDVRLIEPREAFRIGEVTTFVTNDPILRIAGVVESDGADFVLSIETPGGIPALDRVELPIRRWTLDLGSSRTIAEIVFTPIIEREDGGVRSFGVRSFTLEASADGRTYGDPIPLFAPSGIDTQDGRARVPLPVPVTGRFFRLYWDSGWQRRPDRADVPDIRLEAIDLVEPTGTVVASRIARVETIFEAPQDVEPFTFSLLLREGKNTLRVEAFASGPPGEAPELRSDTATVTVTLLPELPTPTADVPEPVVLSDGNHLAIELEPGAADERLRGLDLIVQDPAEIPAETYRRNRRIRDEIGPLLAYRFEGRFQTAFEAEATASLPGQPPSLAVDGRFEFPSTWISSLVPFPISWTVDLRQSVVVGRIVVHARRVGGISYGPQRAKILVSNDNATFDVALEADQFNDETTTLTLPSPQPARWVRLLIEEGKQPNNVQINEIEFFDAGGSRILAQEMRTDLLFRKPIRLLFRYYRDDLDRVGLTDDATLGVFLWNPQIREWQWIRAEREEPTPRIGGGGLFRFELNVLAPIALFAMTPIVPEERRLAAAWTSTVFSPNGDGVIDTNRLSIFVRDVDAMSGELRRAGAPPEITVRLFNIAGKRIRTLADRTPVPSRSLTIEWDGRDRNDRPVPIGPYIYQVELFESEGAHPVAVYTGTVVVAR